MAINLVQLLNPRKVQSAHTLGVHTTPVVQEYHPQNFASVPNYKSPEVKDFANAGEYFGVPVLGKEFDSNAFLGI